LATDPAAPGTVPDVSESRYIPRGLARTGQATVFIAVLTSFWSDMARIPIPALTAAATLVAGCAEPNPPLPPPQEVLVVANSTAPSLSVASISPTGPEGTVSLSGTAVGSIAAFGPILLAALPLDDAVDVVALEGLQVRATVGLPAGSGATGAAVLNDSVAYVANPNLNTITRIDLVTGDTASLAVGTYPQGLIGTRGSLFVINGNVMSCAQPGGLCPVGPSWLTVVDPETNDLDSGVDSIPMLGPGNARYAAVGADGLLYVMNRGIDSESQLSIIDPVGRREVASFGGFGTNPGQLGADHGERIIISSTTDGVMEFNTRARTVDRGAGSGVAVQDNSGLAVDGSFRTYAVQSGGCAGSAGQAVVLDSTLVPVGSVPLGTCAADALVTLLRPGGTP